MSVEYYKYLTSISWKGKAYRRFFVYPKIKKYCNGDILDIGCGAGLFLDFCKSGIGVDINQSCVDYCIAQGIDARHMNEDTLDFPNSSFDTLIMDNVMEHIMDPQPLLGECRRVLKPAGTLIILVPGIKGYAKDPDHKVYYNHDNLKNTLIFSGLSPIEKYSLPFPGLSNFLNAFCLMVVAENDKY